MELRHLRYFVAVAEEESVTRAAARLHVSQPPLSRQIRDLERELGVNLLDRNSKGVRLTDAGEVFLAEARGVLQRADDAADMVKAIALGKRGRVRVGHAPAAVEILGRALRSFSRTHPDVSVELHDMGMGMLRRLRDGTLDVAITAAVSPADLHGLVVDRVAAYAMCVAMSRNHRLARLRVVPVAELAREPIVVRGRKEYPYHRLSALKILEPHTSSPNFVEEHESFDSVVAAVEAGRGITFMGQMVSRMAGKRLVVRPLRPAPAPIPVVVAYHPNGLSAAASAFVAATKAARRAS